MREIKFRAWDGRIASERMLNGFELDRNIVRTYGTVNKHEIDITTSNTEKVILMQYTGLKDKDGVEIYEGDIVGYRDGEYSFDAVVEWTDYYWYMRGIEPLDNFEFEDTSPSELEVIGNIYENPELLK